MLSLKNNCYKGTRILIGNEKRELVNSMIKVLLRSHFNEIQLPIIQPKSVFNGKVGEENNNMMFTLTDLKGRDLCLAPEYTAVIQQLATTQFKHQKDVRLFYIAECFRGERPQSGRYRQFTQLGVEILNPSQDYTDSLIELANKLTDCLSYMMWEKQQIESKTEFEETITIITNVTRGLDYYIEGKGFEITCDSLGSSKQICGGGAYEGGIGFALGIDRLLNLLK